jgi:hypothetical protein
MRHGYLVWVGHLMSDVFDFALPQKKSNTNGDTQESPMIKLKSNPLYYERQFPHYQKQNCILFITFCKLLPGPLSETARSIVLRHCLHDHDKKLKMHAAVVLPAHVHLLLSPLRDSDGGVFSTERNTQTD